MLKNKECYQADNGKAIPEAALGHAFAPLPLVHRPSWAAVAVCFDRFHVFQHLVPSGLTRRNADNTASWCARTLLVPETNTLLVVVKHGALDGTVATLY